MTIEIFKHKDVLFKDLLRIVNLKKTAWPYPVEKQIKWILENQSPDDLHFILKDDNADLAYLDLCPVIVELNGIETDFLGIGNVCAKTHGMGHGGILINEVNSFLKENNKKGLLFCKEHLVGFYSHLGWELVPNERVIIEGINHKDIFVMCYNTFYFNNIIYRDRLF